MVGAGVSGLVAAYLLQREHQVTVFEAAAEAGGHVHTVPVATEHGTYAVDTGFIVFNDVNYPNFRRLLRRLGVGEQRSSMTFSVSCRVDDFEYASGSANQLFAKRSHLVRPQFYRMLYDKVRWHREARRLLERLDEGPTIGEFLDSRRYSRTFVDRLMVPQVAAVWSSPCQQARSFPAKYLAEFLNNHQMLRVRNLPTWSTIPGGSARYVDALTGSFAEPVRTSTPIRTITRGPDGVELIPHHGEPEQFDHVVVATHSDQALRLLADPSPRERELLSAFEYQPNDIALHTDQTLLPRRRRAWAAWNYHIVEGERGGSTVTYHMNRLQAIDSPTQFCVTLNHLEGIDEAQIVQRLTWQHPVYTHRSVAAQERHESLIGPNRTSFAGAYWGYGFHEDGVESAMRVARPLGGRLH